jgi:hypothetical protein
MEEKKENKRMQNNEILKKILSMEEEKKENRAVQLIDRDILQKIWSMGYTPETALAEFIAIKEKELGKQTKKRFEFYTDSEVDGMILEDALKEIKAGKSFEFSRNKRYFLIEVIQ